MKKSVALALSAACMIVLVACSETRPLIYSSTASLSRAVSNTRTSMRLNVCGPDHPSSLGISVISAVDSMPDAQHLAYVLIAPMKNPDRSRSLLSNYALSRGATLRLNEAEALVAHLRNAKSSWSTQTDAGSGRMSEFLVVPSGRQIQVSDSVVTYYPSLEVYSSRIDGKSSLELRLKEGRVWIAYVLDDEEEVECMINMMDSAIRNSRDW